MLIDAKWLRTYRGLLRNTARSDEPAVSNNPSQREYVQKLHREKEKLREENEAMRRELGTRTFLSKADIQCTDCERVRKKSIRRVTFKKTEDFDSFKLGKLP